MTDWADKIATAMFRAQDDDVGPMDVADLLREARLDALEEAAITVDELANQFWAGGEDIVLLDAATAIRALKERQP